MDGGRGRFLCGWRSRDDKGQCWDALKRTPTTFGAARGIFADAKIEGDRISRSNLAPGQAGAQRAAALRARERCARVLPAMTKLGIYVQVPFCQTKCTYCNFHTGVVSSARFAPYVRAMCEEIREHTALYRAAGILLPAAFAEAVVDTVYIGGGTPSLLEPGLLQRLLDTIRARFAAELTEVTLEADPETIEPEKAAAWVHAGINRVSFGVQSFSDRELVATGRMHRRADIDRAVGILRDAGIGNISFDLIAGLPHQTRETWKNSLEELAGLAPEHVSVYLLEIDEGSRLGGEVLRGGERYSAGELRSEDEMAEFYETACEFLGWAGYRHYEISNWGKPGLESRHNLKYWRRAA